jgi:hypothetical protein
VDCKFVNCIQLLGYSSLIVAVSPPGLKDERGHHNRDIVVRETSIHETSVYGCYMYVMCMDVSPLKLIGNRGIL